MVTLHRTLGLLVVIALYAYILAMVEAPRRGLLSDVCGFCVDSVCSVALLVVADVVYGVLVKISLRALMNLDY